MSSSPAGRGGRAAAVKGLAGAYGGPLAAGSDAMIQLFDPGADAEDALDLRVVHAMLLKDCVDRGESRGESPSCFALAAALACAAPPPLTKRHRCTLVRLSLPLFPTVVPQLCAWRGQPPGPPCRPNLSAP